MIHSLILLDTYISRLLHSASDCRPIFHSKILRQGLDFGGIQNGCVASVGRDQSKLIYIVRFSHKSLDASDPS